MCGACAAEAVAGPLMSASRRAASEAESTTAATRTYCMKATRRGSEPYSSDIATMAAAPPGAEPQAAVVPGRTCSRVSTSPTSPLTATVTRTTARITHPSSCRVLTISPVTEWATRQPTTACEAWKAGRGKVRPAPRTPKTMAASIGPSRKAAGKPA